MCDTVAFPAVAGSQAIFGKNSDREPGEPQLLEYVTAEGVRPHDIREREEKPAYVEKSLPVLETALAEQLRFRRESLGALISRPSWMWGAEMGVNEAGVSIGNEAVFSRRKSSGSPLLGMDILRLALHFGPTAGGAADVVEELVEKYGQGGDGGWKHKSQYSNSYLIQDAVAAWLVESSGSRTRRRRIDRPQGISNTYDSASSWDRFDNLKTEDERRLFAFGARSAYRNNLKKPWLSGDLRMAGPSDMFALLRNHGTPDNRIHRGMGSICIHTGRLIKSETTASLVVQWRADGPVAWATGSSWPCLSIFKPFVVNSANPTVTGVHLESDSRALRATREFVGIWANRNPDRFQKELAPRRDALEAEFVRQIEGGSAADLPEIVESCHQKEQVYLRECTRLTR